MAKAKKSEKVPKAMQTKFNRIVEITDAFCQEHLNDEYAQLIRSATAALARKRPSPLTNGLPKSWASGITHAIGMVNFLFDPAQDPYCSAKDLYKWFGVASSTGQGKSKQVRDLLDMSQMDPDWCLPSMLDRNPMAWMISVNGLIVDARSAPREFQKIAYEKGLIPYIPDDDKIGELNAAEPSEAEPIVPGSPDALYKLEVFLMDGPVTEQFVENNPVVARSISIKGSNTLQDLHQILFKAFDREEEHLYEFQVGGKRPNDPIARRYGLTSVLMGSQRDIGLDGNVADTTIASLGLSVNQSFGYWFDFGDSWWHQVNVLEIVDKAPKGKYPKVTDREGDSPPQYADFDE
ncbi:MAG: plasmid pRiA4b ORF-3 family protein [Synechococcus sp.]